MAGRFSVFAEGLHEFGIAHGLRSHNIHRPVKAVVSQREKECADDIVECDPAHVLASIADFPAKPKAKRGKHRLQRATMLRQDDADTKVHDANPGFGRGMAAFSHS